MVTQTHWTQIRTPSPPLARQDSSSHVYSDAASSQPRIAMPPVGDSVPVSASRRGESHYRDSHRDRDSRRYQDSGCDSYRTRSSQQERDAAFARLAEAQLQMQQGNEEFRRQMQQGNEEFRRQLQQDQEEFRRELRQITLSVARAEKRLVGDEGAWGEPGVPTAPPPPQQRTTPTTAPLVTPVQVRVGPDISGPAIAGSGQTAGETERIIAARPRREFDEKQEHSRPYQPEQGAQQRRRTNTCYRCCQPGHRAAECRVSTRVCYSCGQPGHRATTCTTGQTQQLTLPVPSQRLALPTPQQQPQQRGQQGQGQGQRGGDQQPRLLKHWRTRQS